jgi:hypothetical protein
MDALEEKNLKMIRQNFVNKLLSITLRLVAESRHFVSADRSFLWNLFFPYAPAESAAF